MPATFNKLKQNEPAMLVSPSRLRLWKVLLVNIRSKHASNVEYIFILFTQHDPLKGAKTWLHEASQQMKKLKNYLTEHILYKKKHKKVLSNR